MFQTNSLGLSCPYSYYSYHILSKNDKVDGMYVLEYSRTQQHKLLVGLIDVWVDNSRWRAKCVFTL